MFDLFRLMVLRPPQDFDPNATIAVDHVSDFLLNLRQASTGQAPLVAMQRCADSFVRSELFVAEASSLNHFQQYEIVREAVTATKVPTIDELNTLVEKLFDAGARDIALDNGFLSDKIGVQDSLVALQLTPPPKGTRPAQLLQACRTIDLIERVGKGDPSLKQDGAVQKSLLRLVVLPADLFPIPAGPAAAAPPTPPVTPVPADSAGSGQQIADRAAGLHEVLQALGLAALAAAAAASRTSIARPAAAGAGQGADAGATSVSATRLAKSAGDSGLTGGATGSVGAHTAMLRAITPAARQVVDSLGLDLANTPLAVLMDRLNSELAYTLNRMTGSLVADKVVPLPPPIPLPRPDPFHEPPATPEWAHGSPGHFPFPPSTPNASIKPAGIADLLVVREHALGYEPGEIAFVENVARGEIFKRNTGRKTTTENSTLTTTISASETERDLQTTDRFGLQRQSQSTIQQLAGSVAGMGISDAYGPLVDSSGSVQQSTGQVSSYGQDVTRRAVSKLTQSVETQVFQRATTAFSERVEHEFDNAAKAADQIVVYQWLDKIVQAKVFTYGKRVLYDLVVPEPAAFLAYEMQKWQPELAALQKPTLFSRQAHVLSDDPKSSDFYQYWATGYGASGIQPPPEPQIVIAKTYGNVAKDPFGNKPIESRSVVEVSKDNVTIPEGYQAQTATIDCEALVWVDGGMALDIDIGQNFAQGIDVSKTPITLPLRGEVGQIPLTVSVSGGPATYTVAIEIVCVRTPQSMAQWQERTCDIILQASRDRLAEYEDRFNALKAELTVKLAGKSSDEKLSLIRAELEKSCIAILSNQQFDAFNAIDFVMPDGGDFPQDYTPQLYLPNVEPVGRYIRFFQQVFEWDQMLYLYYPYFWGRKRLWNNRIQLDDQDPDFAAFLGAGAARVTLPVRPGYEQAVADFMNKGIVPTEADLLSGAVTTGLYVPFFAELMGAQGDPETVVPYGDPPLEWLLRVPTTLTKVRTDNTLPKWASDTWLPVNPGDSENP